MEMKLWKGQSVPVYAPRAKSPPRAGPPGLVISPDALTAYLDHLRQKGRAAGTLETYRRNLYALFAFLPADKTIHADTLALWRQAQLAEGYSPRTVNARMSTINGLISFLGRRDLQYVETLKVADIQPELTRAEYLRLLTTARALDQERLYLLVKLFGSTGLPVRDLSLVTVEALTGQDGPGQNPELAMPDFFRQELLSYARREGITTGPLFVTKSGKPLSRTAVTYSMKRLCQDAQVSTKKATPRCLKRMWQSTQDGIRAQIDLLVAQAFDQLMATEQSVVGWKEEKGVRPL